MTTKGNGYTEQNLLQLRYLLIVRQSRFERESRSHAQKTYTIGIISNIIRPRLLIQCRKHNAATQDCLFQYMAERGKGMLL